MSTSTCSFHATFAFTPNPHMYFWSLARSRAMRWHLRLGRWGRQICSCIVLSEQWACALPAARQAGCTWNFVKEFMVKAWVQVAKGWQALDNMWAGGWVCGDGGRCRHTVLASLVHRQHCQSINGGISWWGMTELHSPPGWAPRLKRQIERSCNPISFHNPISWCRLLLVATIWMALN